MKKISLFIIGLLFLIPIGVFAADTPEVDTLEASVSGSTISYNGTTINGATAVVCKLYDSSNKKVKQFSVAVSEDKFEGEFTAPKTGDYEVRCANYEGGNIKVATAKVTEVSNPTTTANPETGDNIKAFILLFVSGLILIPSLIVVRKKYNK